MKKSQASSPLTRCVHAICASAISLGLLSAFGCGGSTLAKGFVQILPGPVQVGTGGNLVVFAEATPANVTWSITPGTGCTGSGCGTITNPTATSMTYLGPDSIPGTSAIFTLTATSVANPSISASQTYTIFPVSVQISGPTNTTVSPLTSAAFTASITGDPTNGGVTWSLSGANCSGNGLTYTNCGQLTNATGTSVTYTAPGAPALETITLTSTSVSFPGTSVSYTITVPKLIVYTYSPTTLPAAVVGQQYTAVVQVYGGDTPPYTFTVNNLPSWAAFTPLSPTSGTSFTITGTPPTGSQGISFVQVNISDSTNPPDQASKNFTIPVYPAKPTGNNLLTGTYAFYGAGWLDGGPNQDNQGVSYVGSFTADGNGNITGGELDVNNFETGFTSYTDLGGTYNIQYSETTDSNTKITTLDPNYQTGYITLILPGNARPLPLAVTFRGIQHDSQSPSLATDLATAADFIEFDDTTGDTIAATMNSSGQRTSGAIALQSAAALNQSSSPFQGNFVFGMNGNSSANIPNYASGMPDNSCYKNAPLCGPISLAGIFTVAPTGTISAGEQDVMFATNYTAAVANSLTGSFANNGATDANGRTTASIKDSAVSSTMLEWPSNFIVYAIDNSHFYIMSSDSFLNYSNLIGTSTVQDSTVATNPLDTTQAMSMVSSVVSTQYYTGANGANNGKVRTQIQVVTPVLGLSSCSAGQYALGGPQYQNLSGSYTAYTTTVGSIGYYCNILSANGRVQPTPATNGTANTEPIIYLYSTNSGYGTQWNGGSGPGLWRVALRNASSLSAGTYSESQFDPTSSLAPQEIGSITLPTNVTYASNASAVPFTIGTDFTQFSAIGTVYQNTPPSTTLYTGPITGSLTNQESYKYTNTSVSTTYTGIFPIINVTNQPLVPTIIFNPQNTFQGCQTGYGFILTSTSFVCINTADQFSTPHIFQQ